MSNKYVIRGVMNCPRLQLKLIDAKTGEPYTPTIQVNRERFCKRLRLNYKIRNTISELKVIYAPGFRNEGTYSTLSDLLQAYRAFTEKSLGDEFREAK